MGTKSHTVPQLSIGDILAARGHKVTFAGYNDTLSSWLKGHSKIHPVDMGANPVDKNTYLEMSRQALFSDEDLDLVEFLDKAFDFLMKGYVENVQFYRQWIRDNSADVIICDASNSACVDAAHDVGCPFVITVHMLGFYSRSWGQPYISNNIKPMPLTYENVGFIDRLLDRIILPAKMISAVMEMMKKRDAVISKAGITPYSGFADLWRHGFILVNSFIGFELPRALPSNTFMIGFGTAGVLPIHRVSKILYSLLAAHRDGLLDGVIWGLVLMADNKESIPQTITIDGVDHSVEDMRSGKHPVIRLLDNAPQRAVLAHPSAQLFVTHCGIGSIYETLYAGVPVLGLPGFGDQLINANKMAEHKAGLWLSKKEISHDTLSDAFHRLLSPGSKEAKEIRTNINRLQAGRHPGAILAHESADFRMPWWKAGNYDLYAFILLIVATSIYLFVSVVRYGFGILRLKQKKQKQA
ncbi:hypothetical protein BDF19DRAFT_419343 [Syncephalis fuscata]|nr:hypothetical protein BDF19DRAFT_419343 [Syncephalis fuscata]